MVKQKVIGVDIGNTSIKSCEFTESGPGEVERWMEVDELISAFHDAFFVVVNVRKDEPEIERSWRLTRDTPLPLKLDYQTPDTLGLDRIAAAVGAWKLFPNTNLLVIDGGSCITYDTVTAEGMFQGGIISPGLDMRYRAMHEFTGKLPRLYPSQGEHPLPGKSTMECIRAGAEVGLKNEIEGFLETFNKKLPELQVVTTGGSLPSFESRTKKPIFASSKIVLGGLYTIWKFNEET